MIRRISEYMFYYGTDFRRSCLVDEVSAQYLLCYCIPGMFCEVADGRFWKRWMDKSSLSKSKLSERRLGDISSEICQKYGRLSNL